MAITIDMPNGWKFTDVPTRDALTDGSAILLVHTDNGVKAIKASALSAFVTGDLSGLKTTDKTGLIAAINEVLGVTGDNASAITALQTSTKMLSAAGASRANSFIYEYNLGTSFTNEQSADIVTGTFEKVRPGGYWTINGHKYWAGHADYRLHCGDTELTTHHMLVFPDKSFYNAYMNATNVTTGAYYGSNMVLAGLADALATVKADFGESHVLTYRNLLANAVSGGSSSNWAWYDRQIDLMNECMVYGHQVWGTQNGYNVGCDKTQIALFQARPIMRLGKPGAHQTRKARRPCRSRRAGRQGRNSTRKQRPAATRCRGLR